MFRKNLTFYLTFLLIILHNVNCFCQKKFTVLVPTKRHTSSSPSVVPDYGSALEIIRANIDLYASTQCMKKINSEVEEKIYKERKNVTKKTNYILAVDYKKCKVIALIKNKGSNMWNSSTILHYIDLYPIMRINGREY